LRAFNPVNDEHKLRCVVAASVTVRAVLNGTCSDRAERREALARVRRWAPVFGCDHPPVGTVGFDLAVIDGVGSRDPGSRPSRTLLATLREHALVLSYLSVGTVEDWRPYAASVPQDWTLGPVPDWPGERYADVRAPGWRELMVAQARQLAAAGFDGLYLDNLDVAEEHPALAAALVELVAALRAAAPELLLVAQNGLAVADQLAIDAIAHEDVFARWEDGYRPSPRRERQRLVAHLRRLAARRLPVLTLDYAQPGSALAADAVRRALAEGFRPAVSVLALDRLPHATADLRGAAA
jgi:cysteinyl-tRNA synthetase, unknown class